MIVNWLTSQHAGLFSFNFLDSIHTLKPKYLLINWLHEPLTNSLPLNHHHPTPSALLILISVSVYGTYFRGSKPYLPFGWSYWFAVVACFLFLSNAIFMLFVTISVRKKRRMSPMKLYVMKDSDKQHQRLQ